MKSVFLNRYKEWGHPISPEQVEIRQALRVSTLKCKEGEVVKALKDKDVELEKIPYLQNGYFYTSKFSLGSTPEHLQGNYYLQDAASQIPVQILDPKPGEKVLDMCAAPGGKTTQMAAMMKNKGIIAALDIQQDRLKSLKNNIERIGANNIIVINKDARFASDLGMKFDKVLLDAPCSGNFCIEKDWFLKRNMEDIKQKAFIQKQLLKEGVRVLKKDGLLVYSTCSLEREENEDVIDWAANELDIELIEMNLGIGEPGLTDTTSITRRLWPDKTLTSGFFVAKMIKQ